MFEAKNNGAFGGELKRPRGFALISKFWQHGNGGGGQLSIDWAKFCELPPHPAAKSKIVESGKLVRRPLLRTWRARLQFG